jgi:hypothetical protein
VHRVRQAAAACGLLLITACGAPYSDAAQGPDTLTRTSVPTRSTETSTKPRVLTENLTVTVSPPTSFTPTEAAYPKAQRAVAFELIIMNEGRTTYRPSRLAISALSNGESARQVVDSTQGYTGFVGAIEDVPPGQSVRVVVAFAVPVGRAELQVMVQPDAEEGSRVMVFEGGV